MAPPSIALKKAGKFVLEHRYGAALFALLISGAITGLGCVLFMRGFEYSFTRRLDATTLGAWGLAVTPLLFVAAVGLIRSLAPFAAGTGIPQAVFAAEQMSPAREGVLAPLVSIRTVAVKVVALYLGVVAGASTGREGPTVHVAVGLFLGCLLLLRKTLKVQVDPRAAVIAGAAAGLAAAFNTPLAGVAFAVEELSVESFGGIKDYVVMAVVAAGLTARSLTGEYTYFGRIDLPLGIPLRVVVFVGLVAGLAGAGFSWVLLEGQRRLAVHAKGRRGLAVTAGLAFALAALTLAFGTAVVGPGNEVAQSLLAGASSGADTLRFPFVKAAGTLLTYWSGMAGGIFAPCLGMGAGLGATLASWAGESVPMAALIGMAAFLAGAIQAPITAFVIIYEMTGAHATLLPVMLAALIAYMTARLIGAPHLYESLASWYEPILEIRRVHEPAGEAGSNPAQ